MFVFYVTILRAKLGDFAKNRNIVTIAASPVVQCLIIWRHVSTLLPSVLR
jgi:hypothetical protein